MFKEIKNFNNIFLIQRAKHLVILIFLCSFVINLLTIIVSFYSMQIFDKVLNSSSLETLFYLTFLTIIFIFFINFFCNFRNDLMQKINTLIIGLGNIGLLYDYNNANIQTHSKAIYNNNKFTLHEYKKEVNNSDSDI